MNIKWNTQEYEDKFQFVHKYGEDVTQLINADAGAFVVDLGCGNGALSKILSQKGYRVLGIDASADMIETAQKNYPNINFKVVDATEFQLQEKADVIFSNAVLHWIDADKQEKLINNISNQLKAGGQLVCEFGGKGCGETVHATLEKKFAERGMKYPRTFYFPTIGEYAPRLEKYGLRVEYAVLFDRPTEQKTENGLEDWIRMFVKEPFKNVDDETKNEIIQQTVNDLRDKLYIDGKWFVDYVRIRIRAKKIV